MTEYNPKTDGNRFAWILREAQRLREARANPPRK